MRMIRLGTLGEGALKLSFWRGGTSKGAFIQNADLWKATCEPKDRKLHQDDLRWLENHKPLQPYLSALMGSPDPSERQLIGLGGGISSLSKAIIVQGRATNIPHDPIDESSVAGKVLPKDDCHIQYAFAQIGVRDGELDMSGNCGNLSAAVGPYAVSQGMIDLATTRLDMDKAVRIYEKGRQVHVALPATIDMFNDNTNKVVRSTFMVSRPKVNAGHPWSFEPRGEYTMPGVPGTGSEIRLKWLNPGGSKTPSALPTGNVTDTLTIDGENYIVSLIDVSNPGIFIDGRRLGWDPTRSPDDLNAQPDLMAKLDLIRREGTEMMGLDPNIKAVPKIVMVFPSSSDDRHIECQAISMQKAHKAVPGTLAMNLGAACQMPGTIPHQLARQSASESITIGHPTGTAEIGAKIDNGKVDYVGISRTARCLMMGFAYPVRSDYRIASIDRESASRLITEH